MASIREMTINRQGVTRIVLVFKSFVIKIPNFSYRWDHFLLGVIGNIRENKTWKYNEDKRNLLCPVLWCSWGGWILIMKRASVCKWNEDIDYEPWVTAGLGGDDKPSNYGKINGKIVKIDYN